MKKKRVNQTDLTLRNLRAEKKRLQSLKIALAEFADALLKASMDLRKEIGEMSVAVILLLTFLSGLGIVVFDHQLSKREREEAAKKIQVEQNVAWENLPNNGEIR